MIDVRADSIIYQSQVYYQQLINELTLQKRLGKSLQLRWEKADTILGYLQAYNYRDNLTDTNDITRTNYILEALIRLCELNQYPVSSPLVPQPVPTVLVGQPGQQGPQGIQGLRGFTGLATDFSVISTSFSTVVDSFNITDAKAARWDYVVVSSTGAQRASSIVGQWTPDGLNHEVADDGTDDLIGDTSGIEFDINISGTTVQLVAVITSGIWSITGSRYFIPNNGNGSGPITNVLPLGQVYIGNSSNQAQAQTLSGAATVSSSGVLTLSNSVVSDANVSSSAAIALSKLAALPINRLVITDGTGVLTTLASPTLTQVGYLTGVTSGIQSQLDNKLTDPMTTIGDLLYRNSSNVTARLGIGSNNQVLTVVGGNVAWQNVTGNISGLTTTFIPKASSSTSLVNSIISETTGAITIAGTAEIQSGLRTQPAGSYFFYKRLDIGPWNMFSGPGFINVAHGLGASFTKLAVVGIVIINDAATTSYPSPVIASTAGDLGVGVVSVNSTNIQIEKESTAFNSSSFSSTSSSRGFIIIQYTN